MSAESREILQIDFQNPHFNRTDHWAKAITGDGFPFADYEWTQVFAPSEEYDHVSLVGATGWMISPHHSRADFPCAHPFLDASSDPTPPNLPPVFVWKFNLGLDRDPNNPPMDLPVLAGGGKPHGRTRPRARTKSRAHELLLVTEQGQIIRMKAGDLRPIGRDTQGVRLMDLAEGDRLVSIAGLSEPEDED